MKHPSVYAVGMILMPLMVSPMSRKSVLGFALVLMLAACGRFDVSGQIASPDIVGDPVPSSQQAAASAPLPTGGSPTPTPQRANATTYTAVPTLMPSPTADLATGLGGFTQNMVDVSTLPEYHIPSQGGGGGGGGESGCLSDIPASQTVSIRQGIYAEQKIVCLYDPPNLSDGAKFAVTLTSPSGRSYSEQFIVRSPIEGDPRPQVNPMDPGRDGGFVESGSSRTPINLSLHFLAGQEYGDWRVEAAAKPGQPFASGIVTVDTKIPIYSVTHFDDPLDPFRTSPNNNSFEAGDRVLFAGRGLQAKPSVVLALYSVDTTRSTATTVVMIPNYATHIVVTGNGSFRAEFVVGSHTPVTNYSGVFDPVAGIFSPAPMNMLVTVGAGS